MEQQMKITVLFLSCKLYSQAFIIIRKLFFFFRKTFWKKGDRFRNVFWLHITVHYSYVNVMYKKPYVKQ